MTSGLQPLVAGGWLAGCSEALRQQLAREARWHRYSAGRTLLQADRLPHEVALIQQGRVRLVASDPHTGPFTLTRPVVKPRFTTAADSPSRREVSPRERPSLARSHTRGPALLEGADP
jgi:hypothetical protein